MRLSMELPSHFGPQNDRGLLRQMSNNSATAIFTTFPTFTHYLGGAVGGSVVDREVLLHQPLLRTIPIPYREPAY